MLTKRIGYLLLLPLVLLTQACTQQFNLSGPDRSLAQRTVTESREVIFPDDNPSIPDGKLVWDKMNCAQCHGMDGKQSSIHLSDKNYMNRQKPLDQYGFLAFGKDGVKHPVLKEQFSRRQIWDLVFYVRSLATPPLSDDEIATIDAVFGSNCAVCHGKRGHGDGPLAKDLEPVPANFHQFNRFYDRSDAILWDHIANGIKWEGMPNFLGKQDRVKNVKFDADYIWKLVQYVRHLEYNTTSSMTQADAPPSGGNR